MSVPGILAILILTAHPRPGAADPPVARVGSLGESQRAEITASGAEGCKELGPNGGIEEDRSSPDAPVENHAAALGWRGLVDTDLQFSEFYGSDHTLAVRFMVQYPHAYAGPILSVNGSGYFFIASGHSILGVELGGNGAALDSPNPVDAGIWYHLAVVRSGNSFSIYLNGQQVRTTGSLPAGGPNPPTGTLRLGRQTNGETLDNREAQFYGFIDDLAVFRRALTADEIRILATEPRLTGDEPDLYAGYTFDSVTPSGGALPPALTRPVSFSTVTPGPVLPSEPAYAASVSPQRDSASDARVLPPPFQQTVMRLPFPAAEAWRVTQGWNDALGSHHGYASFALDFVLAGRAPSVTRGRPILCAGPGKVVETRNDSDTCTVYPANYVMVRQAPEEIAAYQHFNKGSVGVSVNQILSPGDYLGTAGDTGWSQCGAYHLHFALHTLPESWNGEFVTIPAAFSDYEVSSDAGRSWTKVARGVPKKGQWVRALPAACSGGGGDCDVVVPHPLAGETIDCRDPANLRPAITWSPGRYDRFRVEIAWDPAFGAGQKATNGGMTLKVPAYVLPAKKLRTVCRKALIANPADPTIYLRVAGKDLDAAPNDPGRTAYSGVVAVGLIH